MWKEMDIPMIVVFVASSACRRTLLRRAEASDGSEERRLLSDQVLRIGGCVAEDSEVERSIGAQGGKAW